MDLGKWLKRPATGMFVWFVVAIYVTAIAAQTLPQALFSIPHRSMFELMFPLVNFDSGYYFSIAEHGYTGSITAARAFFPLFPLLIAGMSHLFIGVPYPVCLALAALVLNVALVYVLVVFAGKLAVKDFGGTHYTGIGILLYPYSFALVSAYSEATLLVLCVAAFLAARNSRWAMAGMLAGLASASRLPGILLGIALATEYLHQKNWRVQHITRSAGWLALAPAGAALYALYLQFFAGGATTYLRAYAIGWPERKLNLNILAPFAHIAHRAIYSHGAALTNRVSYNDIISVILLGFAVALLIRYWRQLRPSYRVFCVLTILLPLTSSVLYGIGRYYVMLFPLYLLLAAELRHHRRLTILCGSVAVVFQVILITLFVNTLYVG